MVETPRVLHLTLSLSRGGRRNAITGLAAALARRGQQSDLGCLEDLGCLADDVPREFGKPLVLARRGAIDLAARQRLVGFCRERGVDLIHAHDAASLLSGALVRWKASKLRLVYTFHRTASIDTRGLLQKARNSLALVAASAAVVNLESMVLSS